MRTRKKSYRDYGFSDGEPQDIKNYIRGREFSDQGLLMQCCKEANLGISGFLYQSLVEGIGYNKLNFITYIPIGPDDFYGYQRKVLSIFRQEMIKEGKYPLKRIRF